MIRDLIALAYCKQGMLGCSWCMGNSLEPWQVQWVTRELSKEPPRPEVNQSAVRSEQAAHRESRLQIGPHECTWSAKQQNRTGSRTVMAEQCS